MKAFQVFGVAAALAAVASGATAQTGGAPYPSKAIRLIVPFPPGGSNDIVGRYFGAQLSERLGRQVVIDNRGGAGGTIGTELAAKAPADGYTLLVISVAYAMNASIYKLTYDPMKSFDPVGMMGTGPNALAVHPALPVKSTRELVALARSKPGQLQYASAGVGSFQHFGSELFKSMAKVDIVHIPYKGGGPAMIDTIAGHAQLTIGSLIQLLPHFRSGKLKALGTGGLKRNASLPDVPTIAEAVPGYEANNWWGILAPAGTPPDIVKRVNAEMSAIAALQETKKRLSAEGAEPVTLSADEFTKLIAREMTKWGKVAREAGIKGE